MCNWISRRQVIEEAQERLLKELYRRAQPPADIMEYSKKYQSGELTEKDRCYEWHYLPHEVESQIIEDYLEAYNANDQMKEYFTWIKELFLKGGYRTVFKDIYGEGKEVQTGEKTEILPELIGQENTDKVIKLIDDFLGFYRRNLDECAIRWVCMQGPTSNPKTVEEHWGIKVDDSVYKDYDDENWNYSYKDYIDGKITNTNFDDELDKDID